ncbi:hypothetical protein HID58_025375 [Brassica napus]|uniref:RNase H type-1 domain-containing protein n=1 Tax=Brassica napus TaxID=3708 RepID=A0ABQ8CKY7_BRANA|nr:hypothetical protein HID58_025375 [Brassica napus]
MTLAIHSMRECEQAQPRPQHPHDGILFGLSCSTWKSESAGLAWIFTDQDGSEKSSKSIYLYHVFSRCMAEAFTIQGALLNAASLNYHNICLRLDFQELIRLSTGGNGRLNSTAFSPTSIP